MFDQLGQILSIFTAGAAIVYILGGFIVNLYLTQYGIVEYQVLQIKFLAVGLMFLGVDLIINAFSSFLGLLIDMLVTVSPLNLREILLIILTCVPSIAFTTLIYLESTKLNHFNTKPKNEWLYMYIAGILANIPNGFVLSQLLLGQTVPTQGQSLLTIFACGVLAQIVLILYYSKWIYGNRLVNQGIMLIGTGTPSKVQIAGDTDQISLLKDLGVPIRKRGITQPVYLIDETDSQYIIGIQKENRIQPVKVMKKFVTAVIYQGDEDESMGKDT